jgi:hypothetical protein
VDYQEAVVERSSIKHETLRLSRHAKELNFHATFVGIAGNLQYRERTRIHMQQEH